MDKAIETAMKKVAKMNEESDTRFIESKEKKMMFDERMMEMEQQQRRENREFQLKVS